MLPHMFALALVMLIHLVCLRVGGDPSRSDDLSVWHMLLLTLSTRRILLNRRLHLSHAEIIFLMPAFLFRLGRQRFSEAGIGFLVLAESVTRSNTFVFGISACFNILG